MEKTCIILHQVTQNQSTQIDFELTAILLEKFKKITTSDLGIREIYIFECKKYLFVLYVGQIIPFNGWNKKIKDRLEKKINQDNKEMISIKLIDHTYNFKDKDKSSRRLRALGGGIRRLLKISIADPELSKKEFFDNLKIFTISGNSKKIDTQLLAVKNNTKLPNEIGSKMSNSQALTVSPTLAASQIIEAVKANLTGKVFLFFIYALRKRASIRQSLHVTKATLWFFLMKKVEEVALPLTFLIFFYPYETLEQFKENNSEEIEEKVDALFFDISTIYRLAATTELEKKGNGTEEVFWERSVSNEESIDLEKWIEESIDLKKWIEESIDLEKWHTL